jgi:hypothetical protein
MMKLALALAAIILIPAASHAGAVVDTTLSNGRDIGFDLGCMVGAQKATRFPTNSYNTVTHERISYNISRCTGGYIMGTNTDTWKSWNADIKPGGAMDGQDLDGSRWTYSPRTHTYTNLATGRSCAHANLRHVCAPE